MYMDMQLNDHEVHTVPYLKGYTMFGLTKLCGFSKHLNDFDNENLLSRRSFRMLRELVSFLNSLDKTASVRSLIQRQTGSARYLKFMKTPRLLSPDKMTSTLSHS